MKIRTRRSLSFSGCGFLGIYHVGVAVCLRQHAPQLLLERIAGASAGALAACCLICDLPLECMAGDFLRVVQEIQRHSLGAFSPWFNLPECLLEGMRSWLPEDAHLLASGRLHISLTRVSDRRNVVMSEFSSRQELLQALMCSCFIPGLSGLVPPQMEREKELRESPRDLEKEHLNRMTTNKKDVQHKKRRNRKHKTQRPSPQRIKKNQHEKIRNGRSFEMEIRNQEKNHQKSTTSVENGTPIKEQRLEKRPPEEHDHYGSSLMGSTWALLRRVMFAPPLARHMVQVIARHLSQSLTLCEQPHFDLALMQAPAACHSATISCPPSTPLGDSDNDKVKAQRVCEASQIESEDQEAEVKGTSGVH
ncbi:GM12054 [Drosophila sechellia]|uniref:GM12054 n=1 Tax=Drosophila sechellia TaxID=7238 RepID=B4IJ91_DROSE|nr:GM12054 [Drosophila sechellia]